MMQAASTECCVGREQYLAWGLWIGLCIFANGRIVLAVSGSQLVLLAAIAMWAAIFLVRPTRPIISTYALVTVALFLVVVLLSAPLQTVVNPDGNPRVVQDATKILLLFFGTAALRELVRQHVEAIIRIVPILLAAMIAYTYFAGTWDYYDPIRHRFGVPSIGSPNTLGYMLAFSLLMLRSEYLIVSARLSRLGLAVIEAVLLVTLVATQSRGGLVLYVVGLLAYVKTVRTRVLLIGVIVLAEVAVSAVHLSQHVDLERFDLIRDTLQTGGTGRFAIWQTLLDRMVGSPVSMIIGFGPGSIEFLRNGELINDAHSLILEIFYFYGLTGLLALLLLFGWLVQQRVAIENDRWRRLRRSFAIMFILGATFDNYPFDARTLWFTCLVLALMTFVPWGRRARRRLAPGPGEGVRNPVRD